MARVTVVNDNDDFLNLMGDILEMNGHTAAPVRGAEASIEAIARTEPDVLIVDLRLSDARLLDDGWALIVGARAHPRLRDVPIVICTADVELLNARADEIAALADVHSLAKPFRLDDVETLLAQVLSR